MVKKQDKTQHQTFTVHAHQRYDELPGPEDKQLTHDAGREVRVGANPVVDLQQTLHGDLLGLIVVEGVLQPVSDEQYNGDRFPKFVGAGGGAGSKHATSLVQEPSLGRTKPFQMLLGTTLHIIEK